MDTAMVQETLGQLLDLLGFKHGAIAVKQEKGEDFTRVDIESPEPSRIIGWHGETLNALQALLKAIIRSKQALEKAPFLVLDVDNYRRMQEDKVRATADRKADLVRRTGNRIALAPMSPYFRRIVHLHVANSPKLQDLTTESMGEGDYRQIILRLKEEKEHSSEELSPVIADATEGASWDNLV